MGIHRGEAPTLESTLGLQSQFGDKLLEIRLRYRFLHTAALKGSTLTRDTFCGRASHSTPLQLEIFFFTNLLEVSTGMDFGVLKGLSFVFIPSSCRNTLLTVM